MPPYKKKLRGIRRLCVFSTGYGAHFSPKQEQTTPKEALHKIYKFTCRYEHSQKDIIAKVSN
jgi:hypothetical protein